MIDPMLRQCVEQAARQAAQRARAANLDEWLERLKVAAASPELDNRLALAQAVLFAAPVPTWEAVDLAKAAGARALETVGVDGSQIYPLEHSPVLWAYIQAVAAIYFFFLRIDEQEIARVEIPAWVAENPQLVDAVHASALADSRPTGYSYVLSQAHQHVAIPFDLAEALYDNARACYWTEVGERLLLSAKNRMKQA